jgi:hypothetical protein
VEAYPITRWESTLAEMSPPTELRRCLRSRGSRPSPFWQRQVQFPRVDAKNRLISNLRRIKSPHSACSAAKRSIKA